MRILYLYRSSRSAAERAAKSGDAPDTPLYGLNHIRGSGIVAEFFDADRKWQEQPWSVLKFVERTISVYTGLGWNLRQALLTLRRMRQYDVVFATTDSAGLPLAFLKRLLRLHTPLVMASQGLSQHRQARGRNWAFRLHQWSLKAVNHVVVYGCGERNDFLNLFGVSQQRVHWIPFGTDAAFFTRRGTQNAALEEPFALAVGRDGQRDWGTLREAARLLAVPFRVVTSPERWAANHRESRMEVFYNLPMPDLCHLYATCQLVVLPVQENSYSFATTTLLDAMAMGKPVIVTRTRAVGPDGDGYGLIDGKHCRFVPPGDAAALAAIVEHLWHSAAERKSLATAGRQWVQEHSTAAFAKRLLDVLKLAVGPSPTKSK